MNILHLTPYYAPAYAFGGVTRAVEGMARALAARGHIVTVLTTDALNQQSRYEAALDSRPREGDVRVVRVRNRSVRLRGQFNLSTPLGMGQIAADLLKNADILHVHEFRTAENLLVTPVAARTWRTDCALAARHADTQHRARRAQIGMGSAAFASGCAAF